MTFKPKRFWWMWAIGIGVHAFCVVMLWKSMYFVPIVMLIIDVLIIFPDAFITGYKLEGQHLHISRIMYPDIDIKYTDIRSVRNATVLTFVGMTMDRGFTSNYGMIRVGYIKKERRLCGVHVSAKKRDEFLSILLHKLRGYPVEIGVSAKRIETDASMSAKEQKEQQKKDDMIR